MKVNAFAFVTTDCDFNNEVRYVVEQITEWRNLELEGEDKEGLRSRLLQAFDVLIFPMYLSRKLGQGDDIYVDMTEDGTETYLREKLLKMVLINEEVEEYPNENDLEINGVVFSFQSEKDLFFRKV